MFAAILSGFLVALVLFFFGKHIKGRQSLVFSIIPLGIFIYFCKFIGKLGNGPIVEKHQWVPSFGVDLNLTLDGISLLFCLMISGIGFLVFVYTSTYLRTHKYIIRFFSYLSIFMASMLGLVLSDNIMAVFLFWELTSVSSFFLIGFHNNIKACRRDAQVAWGITGIGGLLLLAGGLILGNIAGTYSISAMIAERSQILADPSYILAVALIFGGAFTKSAQFPFHFWLPAAMGAPTPVSTYLHSATMVKAGIYILLRFTPVLGGTPFWNQTLLIVGAVTMVYAAYHSIFRKELKGILAYSTISALGILVFLIGLGTTEALMAAAVFIIVHALYKATLFLVVGAVDMKAGTRDVTKLAGLRKVLFPIAIAGLLAAISNAGIPPSLGFLGKDLIYASSFNFEQAAILLIILAVITKICISYAGYVAGISPFIGKIPEKYQNIEYPHFSIWVPPLLLGVAGIFFGLFPGLLETALIKPIFSAIGENPADVHLKLWHGINPVLGFSVLTMVVGIALYLILKPSKKLVDFIHTFEVVSPKQILAYFQTLFQKMAEFWTNFFQNGYLRNYISVIILALVLLMTKTLLQQPDFDLDYSSLTGLSIYEGITMAIMLIAIFFTVFTKSRLAAVAATGIIGYSICLLFVFYSAPDLAMTQFAIDTLTVVLFVLVLYRLPKYLTLSDYKMRIRDGVLSLAFGSLITVLALLVLAEPINLEISDFYAENSYIMAHGRNVVNVILVDFRGTDTLVEISVLTVAAIGVLALLKLRLRKSDRKL